MTKTGWNNFFLGFAIVTVISGIYLIFQKEYASGICGSVVGFYLIHLQNMNKIKGENS